MARRLIPLIDAAAIAKRVAAMGREIARNCPRDVRLMVALKGALPFGADLLRALSRAGVHAHVAFLTVASYGTATRSSGRVRIRGLDAAEVRARHVLVADDICDSGRTLHAIRRRLVAAGARSVRFCVLLDKPARRTAAVAPEFVGFTIDDHFVVGYGMDLAGAYRDLPHIARIVGSGTPRARL